MESEIFAEYLQEINKGRSKDDAVKVDFRKHSELISEDDARALVNYMANYNSKTPESAFSSYKEFKAFYAAAKKIVIVKEKPSLDELKETVQRKFPILVLIDVGGSILYRSGAKLPNIVGNKKTFC